MTLELDHVLIFTDSGAPVVDRIVDAGFTEGTPNDHTGQGTANRRVFFANAYLEFLFPTDRDALRSPLVAPTGLLARCDGGSPLGVALRGTPSGRSVDFPTWEYRPPYLPAGVSILLAATSDIADELLVAVVPFGRRPDDEPLDRRQPANPPVDPRSIGGVHIAGPWPNPRSAALDAVAALPGVTVEVAPDYHATISLDPGSAGQVLDLRPRAPVSLVW